MVFHKSLNDRKSSGIFLVFWLISLMLLFGWSPLGLLFPPPFLDTYSLSTSSLGCKALCIVMSFLVLWSICWSSLINFKNGSLYLTRGTAQLFIPLMIFLPYNLFSSSFLVLLRYLKKFFFHLHLVDCVRFQYSQVRGAFNKFPDFFVQAFKIVVLLKIHYVIAIHLMR